MKPNKLMPIYTKVYTFTVVKNNVPVGLGVQEISFTKHASFCVKNTDPKLLAPHLEVIAEQNGIDLNSYDQFEYAFDLLRYSVSWN